MGTMSNLIEFQPFDMVPPTYVNPQTKQNFLPSVPFAEPAHLTFFPAPGPFTVAGISEVTHTGFLAGFNPFPVANEQIVSVPERPVDQGTFRAITARSQPASGQPTYAQPSRGIYNQPAQAIVVNKTSVAGSAPVTGVYTGFGDGNNLSYGSIENGVSGYGR